MIVRKNPPEARWEYLYRVERQFNDDWEIAFRESLEPVIAAASVDMLARALQMHDITEIEHLPWAELERIAYERWRPLLEQTLTRGAKAELKRIGVTVAYNPQNVFAQRWLDQHARELVMQVTNETKEAMRNVTGIVRGAMERGDVRVTAELLRDSIGVDSRSAQAIHRYYETLLEEYPSEKAGNIAAKYATKNVKRRADRIARTETIRAVNEGVQTSYELAENEGLIASDTQRRWIAAFGSSRTCPICMELHGKQTGLHTPFKSSILGSVMMPPAHVSCRCAVGLMR